MDVSETTTPSAEFDWGAPGSRPFGLKEMQFRLVQGLLAGKSRTAAAGDAGYRGEGATLRSSASSAAKSRPVKAAIAAYRHWQGRSDEIEVQPAELKGILSKAIRHPATPGERVSAASLLAKIQADEIDRKRETESGPQNVAEVLLKDGQPVSVFIAALISKGIQPVPVIPRKAWKIVEIQYPETAKALENEWRVAIEPAPDGAAGGLRGDGPPASANGSGHPGHSVGPADGLGAKYRRAADARHGYDF